MDMPWLFCQEVPFRAELPVIPTGLESSAQNVTNRDFSEVSILLEGLFTVPTTITWKPEVPHGMGTSAQ